MPRLAPPSACPCWQEGAVFLHRLSCVTKPEEETWMLFSASSRLGGKQMERPFAKEARLGPHTHEQVGVGAFSILSGLTCTMGQVLSAS